MATKAHPGNFDCHANAEPHEPLFILLARDPLAAPLVAMWAAARTGDYASLDELQERLIDAAETKAPADFEKLHDAWHCAHAMDAYRAGQPYCRVCLCTEDFACERGCAWANAERTVCDNPRCVAAAKDASP